MFSKDNVVVYGKGGHQKHTSQYLLKQPEDRAGVFQGNLANDHVSGFSLHKHRQIPTPVLARHNEIRLPIAEKSPFLDLFWPLVYECSISNAGLSMRFISFCLFAVAQVLFKSSAID